MQNRMVAPLVAILFLATVLAFMLSPIMFSQPPFVVASIGIATVAVLSAAFMVVKRFWRYD